MKNDCAIVIPVYKTELKISEVASFKQCLTVLNKHDIYLVTYRGLDLSWYTKTSQECKKKINVVYFDYSFFSTGLGYNYLCLNKNFYQSFTQYEYMLIYQLDAWVFRDELQFWCEKGYDWIGAPFQENISSCSVTDNKETGGNGGFCLRKVSYCIKLLDRPKWLPYLRPGYLWKTIYLMHSQQKRNTVYSFLLTLGKTLLKSCGYRNNLGYFLRTGKINEDYYFSEYALHSWGKNAKFPTFIEAACFAFEKNPTFLYTLIHQLPFGCHGFEKWEFDSFWTKYIKVLDNEI